MLQGGGLCLWHYFYVTTMLAKAINLWNHLLRWIDALVCSSLPFPCVYSQDGEVDLSHYYTGSIKWNSFCSALQNLRLAITSYTWDGLRMYTCKQTVWHCNYYHSSRDPLFHKVMVLIIISLTLTSVTRGAYSQELQWQAMTSNDSFKLYY